MTDDSEYEPHPFAEVWSPMTDEQLAGLKSCLMDAGEVRPIVLYQGKILDGRSRYKAGKQLGLPLYYETSTAKSDAEAIDQVLALNKESRQHRSGEELAFALAKLVTFSGKGKIGTVPLNPETAGESFGVSRSAIQRAKIIRRHDKAHGTNLEEQVLARKQPLSRAYDSVASKRPEKAAPKKTKKLAMHNRRVPVQPKLLTREQVDPDFVGTDAEFKEKYGHVWPKTATAMANDRFRSMAGIIDRAALQLLQPREVDPAKLNKVRADDVECMRRGLSRLERFVNVYKLVLAKAEALLVEEREPA